jgi:5'-3' exonuclease
MGLNGCLQFIRNKYPHLLVEEHISKYSHQRVFVDIAGYIYKYGCIFGLCSSKFFEYLAQLAFILKSNNVHPVIVFDGKAPEDKNDEIGERKEKKKQSLDKIDIIEKALEKYITQKSKIELNDIQTLKTTLEKIQNKPSYATPSTSRYLNESEGESESEQEFYLYPTDIESIKSYIEKQKTSILHITPDHFNKMKELFDNLSIPHIQAPEEAESYCCYLVREQMGSSVISFDTDCIAHMATNIIFNLDINSGKIVNLCMNELIEEWELDNLGMKDFAILVGCDYNRKNKLAKIGPVNALKLLQTHTYLHNIPNLTFNLDDINKIRNLFQRNYHSFQLNIEYKDFDINNIQTFFDKHQITFNHNWDYLPSFIENKFKFIDEDENEYELKSDSETESETEIEIEINYNKDERLLED